MAGDIQLTGDHVESLSSADCLVEFFAYLRYPEDARLEMTPEALQVPQKLRDVTRRVERVTDVEGGALHVFLFGLTTVNMAHTRALASGECDLNPRADGTHSRREMGGQRGLFFCSTAPPVTWPRYWPPYSSCRP